MYNSHSLNNSQWFSTLFYTSVSLDSIVAVWGDSGSRDVIRPTSSIGMTAPGSASGSTWTSSGISGIARLSSVLPRLSILRSRRVRLACLALCLRSMRVLRESIGSNRWSKLDSLSCRAKAWPRWFSWGCRNQYSNSSVNTPTRIVQSKSTVVPVTEQ